MNNLSTLAQLIITSGVLALLCLVILHAVSPEFKPSWRMVSEYALGKNKWLLTSFFISWSISTGLAALFYFYLSTTTWAAVGASLIFISGAGALMGGLFDLRHKLHGLSFAVGVPTLPIGALLVGHHLSHQPQWSAYKNELLILAHGPWVSLVFMGVTMGLFFSGLKKAGVPFGPNEEPLTEIPKGVVAINGYANRFLVFVYAAFNIILAFIFLKIDN